MRDVRRGLARAEQIIRKLAEGQKLLAGSMTVEEVCRQFTIAESTWARWLSQYGGMKDDDARRLKELEIENVRLKKLLADAELEKDILKEVAEENLKSTIQGTRSLPRA